MVGRDINILKSQINDTIEQKMLITLVTEAFIKGLPFDKDAITENFTELSKYSSSVLGKMNPPLSLKHICTESSKGEKFITSLTENLQEVIKPITSRIVLETKNVTLDEYTTPEIVDQIQLDKKDVERIVQASKKSGIDAISKVVKKNIIQVIKDEKDIYDRSQKIKDEISEMIKKENDDNSNDNESILESYLNIILSKSDPRTPVSLFSKLQDVCIENYLNVNLNNLEDNVIPYPLLEKITVESSLPYFTIDTSISEDLDTLESMKYMIIPATEDDEEGEEDKSDKEVKKLKKASKIAFISSICILTLLQTLKSMHLISPDAEIIKKYIDKPTQDLVVNRISPNNLENKISNMKQAISKTIALGSISAIEQIKYKNELERYKKWILANESFIYDAFNISNDRLLSVIDGMLESLTKSLETVGEEKESEKITDSFNSRLKEENIVNLSSAIKMALRADGVESIKIKIPDSPKITSESIEELVAIIGIDKNGLEKVRFLCTLNVNKSLGNSLANIVLNTLPFLPEKFKSNIKIEYNSYDIEFKNIEK